MGKGIYRTAGETGTEYAVVDFGRANTESITREFYEQGGYEPPFDKLPTKKQYDALKEKK